MANMCRCKKGLHIYDADKHTLCPHCSSAVFDFNKGNANEQVTRKLEANIEKDQAASADITRVLKSPNSANDQVTRKLNVEKEKSAPTDVTRVIKSSNNELSRKLNSSEAQVQDSSSEVTRVIKRTDSSVPKTRIFRTEKGIRPLTAWLVVIEGPGKGSHLPIFYGMNSIGRSKYVGEGLQQAEQEICLDFGLDSDSEIARESQARLTYDKKGDEFYLQHGGGNSLTYLNGAPVLEPQILSAYDRIGCGKTVLMFIPFCGTQFQWPDE